MKFNEISISIFLKFQFSHSFKKDLESNCQTNFFKVKAKKSDLRVKSWALPGRFSCWRSAHLTLPVGGPKITKLLILKVLDVQSSMAAADARTAMVHTHGQGRPRSPIRQRQCNYNCLQNTRQRLLPVLDIPRAALLCYNIRCNKNQGKLQPAMDEQQANTIVHKSY